MKILFTLTQAFDPTKGGVQRTTFKLGKHFTEKGLQVAYFSFKEKGHIDVEYGTLGHAKEPKGVNNPANIKSLDGFISSFKPDLVINQMPYESPLTLYLGSAKSSHGFKLVGCLRNSLFSVVNNLSDTIKEMVPKPLFPFFNNPIGKGLALKKHKSSHRASLRQILEQHDKYVLLTPPNRKELEYFVGDYMKEKVHSIPNSIPYVLPEAGDRKKVLLHVGRLSISQKRSDLLIPYWKKCMQGMPDWEFHIVGDGPYKKVMEEKIAKEGIKSIKLLGFQDPHPHYKEASIFMMPSAYEGFPNTIIEAHSHALPVLAFNSYPALEWIMNDKKDGYLIEPYDVSKMAQQTISIANDAELLKSMQSKALQNANQFTIEEVGEKWFAFFKELGFSLA